MTDSLSTIPLNKLIVCKGNVRKTAGPRCRSNRARRLHRRTRPAAIPRRQVRQERQI
jgi:hypothetical protein